MLLCFITKVQHQLQHGNDDDYEEQEYNEDQEQVNAVAEDNEVIKNWRDKMAQRMWDQYQIYLGGTKILN